MKRKVIPILILCLFLVACASQQPAGEPPSYLKVTFQTLSTFSTIYDFSMKSIADLHKQGIITNDDRDKAIKYGGDFYRSYQLAVDALLSYMQIKDAPTQAKAEAVIAETLKLYSSFLTLVQPMLQKGVK